MKIIILLTGSVLPISSACYGVDQRHAVNAGEKSLLMLSDPEDRSFRPEFR
jgi:hypothetical protein